MKRIDFQYDLPPELIASFPTEQRDASRLLLLAENSPPFDRKFSEFAQLLKPGDFLVLNNSKVIPARAFGRKSTGGKIEVMLERVLPNDQALVKLKASKAPKLGSLLFLGSSDGQDVSVSVTGREDDLFRLQFGSDPLAYFQAHGQVPLPPYLERSAVELDQTRYQTVYARDLGSVAAPTAGLHFDEATFATLKAANIDWGFVTLHVGSGTYQPVRAEQIEEHRMHAENATVSETLVDKIKATKERGGRIVAIGTTSLRSLEAAAQSGTLQPYCGDTNIFIFPGYRFKVVDALLTNFHLPESTLLMLVSALAGRQRILAAYQHAVAQQYRFFSYGDCMLIERDDGELI